MIFIFYLYVAILWIILYFHVRKMAGFDETKTGKFFTHRDNFFRSERNKVELCLKSKEISFQVFNLMDSCE